MPGNGGVSSAHSSTLRDQALGLDGATLQDSGHREPLGPAVLDRGRGIRHGRGDRLRHRAELQLSRAAGLAAERDLYFGRALHCLADPARFACLSPLRELADATPASLLMERHWRRGLGVFLLPLHAFSAQGHRGILARHFLHPAFRRHPRGARAAHHRACTESRPRSRPDASRLVAPFSSGAPRGRRSSPSA